MLHTFYLCSMFWLLRMHPCPLHPSMGYPPLNNHMRLHAPLPPPHTHAAPDSPLHQYLDNLAGLAWARPGHFLLVMGLIVAAAGLLALQLWIIVTPLSPHVAPVPLLLRQAGGDEVQQQQQQQGGWEEPSKQAPAAAAAADRKSSTAVDSWVSADKTAGDASNWPAGHGAANAASAATAWPGLVSGSGHVGRPVVVGWNVPGVREWLLGAQQAGGSPGGGEEAAALLGAAAAVGGSSSRDEAVSGMRGAYLSMETLLGLLIAGTF
jgi:hypothetical protein